jgi:putative endonuclease
MAPDYDPGVVPAIHVFAMADAGFTKRYALKRLAWYEFHEDITAAIQRESNMKHWPRAWKVRLILAMNPEWRDLYLELNS